MPATWSKCSHPRTPENTTSRTSRQPGGTCRECKRATNRRHRAKPAVLVAQRQRRTGWTVDAFARARDLQHGACAICRRVADLVGDHCHTSNTTRGLLCGPCNRMIGLARDNSTVLRLAADYVESWERNIKEAA